MAHLDKHSTLDPVMVSVVSSNPTGGNFLKIFKPLDVNFGLKCNCDLIVKNSIEFFSQIIYNTKLTDPVITSFLFFPCVKYGIVTDTFSEICHSNF